MQQVNGLKTKIDEFGQKTGIEPNHAGYIVNKALFSPAEGSSFSIGLERLYGGTVFGTIPADRNAIVAYQTRDIPYQQYPGSDFAYYSFLAVEDLLSATRPLDGEPRKALSNLKGRIAGAWRTGRLLVMGERAYPGVALVMLALCLLAFFSYSSGISWAKPQLVFGLVIGLMFLASMMPLIRVFSDRRQSGLKNRWSVIVAATISLTCIALFVLTAPGIRRALSSNTLFQQARSLQEQLAASNLQRQVTADELSKANDQYKLVSFDRDSLKAQLAAAESRAVSADSERARLQLALSAAQSQLSGANRIWQANIEWSIQDKGNVECPSEFAKFKNARVCLSEGGRSCLMRGAVELAKQGDYETAFEMAIVSQCHNPAAAETIKSAGPQAVGDYLRSK